MLETLKEPIKDVWYKMPPKFKSGVYSAEKWRPMESVMQEIKNKGVQLSTLKALEVFGRTGEWHTLDYAYKVGSLEILEIDPIFENTLKRNFPAATIKIVDSYKEIKTTNDKFSLIVVDNPMSTYGDDYCEHFKLFPDIFRVCMDNAIIILNVIPEADEHYKKIYPYLFNENQLQYRKDFYHTDHPEKIAIDHMRDTYRSLCDESGFDMQWSFSKKRSCAHYFVFSVKKRP